ncbi:hypothetical protein FWF74_02195 [Candidatus Saccharibacteria bacterium]|nr:hypothetical protein [Candidatus Saccharibacteria bacterium]
MSTNHNTIDEGNRQVTDEERETFVAQLNEVIDPVLDGARTTYPLTRRERDEAKTAIIERKFNTKKPYRWNFGLTTVRIDDAYERIEEDRAYHDILGGRERSTALDYQYSRLSLVAFYGRQYCSSYVIDDDSRKSTEESFASKAQYDQYMAVLTALETLQRGKDARFSDRVRAAKAIRKESVWQDNGE